METADFCIEAEPAARSPWQGIAHVEGIDEEGDFLTVRVGGASRRARRAASCLLAPEPGDTVAGIDDAAQDVIHVIAVLIRAGKTAPTIGLPPDAVIQSQGGKLEMRADALAFRSRDFSVEAERACLSADQVTGVGGRASWSFGAVKLTADLVETFAERLLQFSRWSRRLVDGPDQVRSRQIDWRAEHSLQLQSQVIIADAEKLLKADGDQIHLG